MKKIAAFALCATLLLSVGGHALAADTAMPLAEERESGYSLYVNGADTGTSTCLMVPLRSFAEQLGFSVVWNGDGTVLMDTGIMHSTNTLGKDLDHVTTSVEGQVGMSAPFSLGMAPFTVDGICYVPLELFEVLLGNHEGTVTLEHGKISVSTSFADGHNAAQIPNPIHDCETLKEAEALAGFSLDVPQSVEDSHSCRFRASKDSMLEVIYQTEGQETVRIRKAPGTGDISGDYSEYSQVDTVTADGVSITMKGSGGHVALAIWTKDGYTYSVTQKTPVSRDDMAKLVSQIH